ncbi:C40 family peptidase [Cellulomonas fimi]|uniref:C40 family peptidase n=1 Tax=Cellulomonas fimi TaxID=1708 RepID=A0A7Y0LZB3_CELFI|nr:C40 family peptidase [Cellulomonas fimi]NMR19492.1 C40 family peptidase [Cellulomonas fimi]
MPESLTAARHRAAGRPTTALDDLAASATGSLAVVGRRSAVAAASSGLVVSMLAAPASAAQPTDAGAAALPTVDTSALTASARAVLDTAPAVTVAADATWTFDVPAVTVIADPPPPPAPVRTVAAASRSQARAAVPTEAAPAAEAETRGAPAPASANGNAIVEIASRYVGVPYVWGGTTPNGFDCSGYTAYVYAQVGITLPRTSSAQRSAGTVVSRADAQPGDLIWTPGHISVYAGGNLQVDAPVPGRTIQIREIWQSNPTFLRFS